MSIPDDLGKDSQTVAALQRRLANFEHDLVNLGTQVRALLFCVLSCTNFEHILTYRCPSCLCLSNYPPFYHFTEVGVVMKV